MPCNPAVALLVASLGFVVWRIAGTHTSTNRGNSTASSDSVRRATRRPHAGSTDHHPASAYKDKHSRRLVVTLVHGTSQPEADWPSPDSDFSKKLVSYIPTNVRIEPFRWCGGNSHEARMRAAEELRAHIARLRNDLPQAEQICIGHSHGGSIIYYALADTAFEGSLLGYAFLSTPFLNFQRRQLADKFLFAVFAVIVLLWIVILSYAVPLWRGWGLFGQILITLLLMIPVARARASVDEFLAGLPKPFPACSKAIFIRTPADEASNGLGILYILTWLETLIQTKMEVKAQATRQQVEAKVGSLRNLVRLLAVVIQFYGTAILTAASALCSAVGFRYGLGKDIAKIPPVPACNHGTNSSRQVEFGSVPAAYENIDVGSYPASAFT